MTLWASGKLIVVAKFQRLYNFTHTQTPSPLPCLLLHCRLVVILDSKAFVYSVGDLSLLRTLDLPPGSGRTATALSP